MQRPIDPVTSGRGAAAARAARHRAHRGRRGLAAARRPGLRFEDAIDQVTIGVAPGGLMETLLRRQAALLGRLPAHRIQVSSLDAACRIVAAGLGLAILPREAAAPHADVGRLSLVPLLDGWAQRQFVLATRSEPLLSASTRLLLGQLQRSAAEP